MSDAIEALKTIPWNKLSPEARAKIGPEDRDHVTAHERTLAALIMSGMHVTAREDMVRVSRLWGSEVVHDYYRLNLEFVERRFNEESDDT